MEQQYSEEDEQIGSRLPQKMKKDFLIKPDNQRSRLDISCVSCGSHSVSYLSCLDLSGSLMNES